MRHKQPFVQVCVAGRINVSFGSRVGGEVPRRVRQLSRLSRPTDAHVAAANEKVPALVAEAFEGGIAGACLHTTVAPDALQVPAAQRIRYGAQGTAKRHT